MVLVLLVSVHADAIKPVKTNRRLTAGAKEFTARQLDSFRRYRKLAKKENIHWGLTFKQFQSYWMKPCLFCGEPVGYIGLGLLNKALGYTYTNTVSQCPVCEWMRGDMSTQSFLMQIELIHYTQKLEKRRNERKGNGPSDKPRE